MSKNTTAAPLTRALSEFVGTTKAGDLPGDVMKMTLTFVRDGAGALVAATNPDYSTGRLVAGLVRDHGGRTESTVIGHGFKTDCISAALANGTMGYACDVEPHHPEGILHPVAVMGPTALAMGERVGASGRAFLTAVALGCEVEYRVSMALGPAEQYALGFHPSAVCGCFGATAAACFLLGLEAGAVERAFGLAACQASGLMAWESDPTENARPFQMGMAARNGVTAALLAGRGFGGPRGIFDAGHTPFRAFSRSPKPEILTRGLGTTWQGVLGLKIKPYPCVAFLHPGLDALLDLVREHDLGPDDIESLVIRFPRAGVHCIDNNPLRSHSAQYILSVAVVDRKVDVGVIFVDRRLTEPTLAALSRRVRVEPDDDIGQSFPAAYATVIEVTTRAGTRHVRRKDHARGTPQEPFREDELVAKFRGLASIVADPARVDALSACIDGLPRAGGLDDLVRLLAAPART